MKKQIILMTTAIFLLISINLISAEIQFWQTKENLGNGTAKNHAVILYSKGGLGITDDYVTGNNPFETYLLYNVYVKTFNAKYSSYAVNYCLLNVYLWGHLQNSTSLVYNQTFTENNSDVNGAKYFMKLNDGDEMIADIICNFKNMNYTGLDIPAEMQIVTPSWECKSCQYYEWSVQERGMVKTKSIGNYITSISGYIKNLFLLNFEIWLALFWLFLILMIFISIGFIFIGVYWIFIYLKRIIK